jgi:hypothetical protein
MKTPFELRSLPADKSRGRLFLLQLPYKSERLPTVEVPTTVARIEGAAFKLAQPAIATALAAQGLGAERAAAFLMSDETLVIDETQALRLGLIFNLVNALRSGDKVQQIVEGIALMSEVETAFWLGKITSDTNDNGRKALIVYLTGTL